MASQPLADGALADLARRRAAAIAEALKSAGVDAARVEVSTAPPQNKADAKSVEIELALSAR